MSDGYVSEEEFRALQRQMTGSVGGMAARLDDIATDVGKALDYSRPPSMAGVIGGNAVKSSSYTAAGNGGEFIWAVRMARSRDADEQAQGKAALASMSRFVEQADTGAKATLGSTDALGGWIIPNAVVDDLVRPGLYTNVFRQLCTNVPGVLAANVDIPLRTAAPARAVIALPGGTKENVDLVYNGYTATMYTIARIYDVANAFLRSSRGAAERDVMTELGDAFALGESWYILNGTGASMPYGVLTALTNSPATFTSSFTASATTLAGSFGSGLATAVGALAARNRVTGLTAIVSPTTYATALSQGSDTAGFFLNGISGTQSIAGFAPGTLISPMGIPIIPDPNITDKSAVIGQWKALKVYFGQDYRVDSSDVAGTRWDTNLTGFRGEEEIGLDARPAVYSGAFQKIASIVP